MISNEETITLSPYMGIYERVVPKDNMLRQINEIVDFSFIVKEIK
ncbi:transposase [Halalkalibacter wakoensis JCM 9140]|uniref:Transposase n=1 Tax=Halalkalibacter wakoensis JCM 9140 TaxID=1236970 RepID=W4Q599_9BACI|nr:transposase [Halalkalibacter wakoensis JCM 9140]